MLTRKDREFIEFVGDICGCGLFIIGCIVLLDYPDYIEMVISALMMFIGYPSVISLLCRIGNSFDSSIKKHRGEL